MESAKQPDNVTYILIILLLILTTLAGVYSYKSIDYSILERLEKEPLNIPPPPADQVIAPISTSSSIKK